MRIALFIVKPSWFESEQRNMGRQSPWLFVDFNAQIRSSRKEICTLADNYLVIPLTGTELSQVECGIQGGIFIAELYSPPD